MQLADLANEQEAQLKEHSHTTNKLNESILRLVSLLVGALLTMKILNLSLFFFDDTIQVSLAEGQLLVGGRMKSFASQEIKKNHF